MQPKGSLRDDLIQMVFEQIQSVKNERLEAEASAEQQRKNLGTSRSTQARHKDNLIKAVRESGGLKSLYEELELVARSIERIDEKLAELNRPLLREVTLEEVREFVNRQMDTLEELLLGSAEALKMDFQKRIEKIVVTPDTDERGKFFRITGDLDLFVAPEDVVQTKQVYPIGLHYKIPVSCTIAARNKRRAWPIPVAMAA